MREIEGGLVGGLAPALRMWRIARFVATAVKEVLFASWRALGLLMDSVTHNAAVSSQNFTPFRHTGYFVGFSKHHAVFFAALPVHLSLA